MDNISIEILKNIVSYLFRYGNLVIYIVGTVGNLLSIFIFSKKQWKKNVCVFYFLVCLLLSLVYLHFTILGTSFLIGWNMNLDHTGLFLCKLMLYVPHVISTLLPTVFILASIDRLLISSQNVDTRLYSSKRLAYLMIGISTFFWIVFNFHVLIKVHIYEIYPSYSICYYDQSKFYVDFVTYSVMIFNCLFCLLTIVLSILSFKNVRRIRAIPRQQRKQIRSMTKKDFQLLRCLFVHNIVYISLSIIPNLYSVYQTITRYQIRTPLEQAIINFLDRFCTFTYFIFYCSSFFIFVRVSKAFRHEVKRLIYKILGKDLMALREEENKQENVGENNVELNIDVVNMTVVPS